jgi:predicted secreted protein
VPIAGATRTANARAALAQAQSAAENLARLEQELTAGFEARWAELNNRYKAAANLAAAADKQARSAASVRRAFAQGEFSTAQVIQTERQAAELRTQAQLEQLEVVALLAQLQLDLHQIWDFDD